MISLSIVDQSPMRRGGSAAEALRETVELARAAERWGYRRFWLAEHHNANSWAGTCPEILAAHVASATRTLRVGTGGVMLANSSPLRVAEQFRLLSALHPARIDLGIGRGAGAMEWVARVLSSEPPADAARFTHKLGTLLALLAGDEQSAAAAGAAAGGGSVPLRAAPGGPLAGGADVWLLGSGGATARIAAALGLPFAYAEFLATDDHGADVAAAYRRDFRPSPRLAAPKLTVAVEVMCAPTASEARRLAESRNLDRVADVYGLSGLLPPDEAARYPIAPGDRRFIAGTLRAVIDGDPGGVCAALLELGRRFATDDLTVVTNCHGFAERLRSFELVAAACGLAPRAL